MSDRLRTLARTLKLRVAAAAGLLVLVAVTAATALTLAIVERDAREGRLADQADAAGRAAAQVGERFAERREVLAALARALPASIAHDAATASRALAAQPTPPSLFVRVFVVRPDGRPLASLADGAAAPGGPDLSALPFLATLGETGRAATSPPMRLDGEGRPVVAMLEPIVDEDGRVAALLGAAVPLDGVAGLGSIAARAAAGSETVIVERTRMTVVGHADADRLLGPASAAGPLAAVLDRVAPRLGDDEPRGADRFGAGAVGWASVPGTDWVLFELADGDRVGAALARTRHVAALASLAFAAACTVAMFAGLMWMFRPITQLRDRALRVLTEPADVDRDWPVGRDEIGELSRVFRHILRERATVEQGSLRTIGQLQAILDNASVGIAFTRHQRFELISRSMAELTGYTRAALFGRPTRLLSPDDATHDALTVRIGAALAAQGRFEVEHPMRRADGSTIWVRAVGSLLDRAVATSGTIWIVEDITEARRLREQLSWSATRDPLTELLNRREFEARLGAHLARPSRPEGALLVLDLDRFKAVNDAGGHAAGDRLLCELARAIEAQVRQVDSVARLGGDEFAVLLVGCPLARAVEIAGRIRVAVGDYRLEWQGALHSVGVSVGVVAIDAAFGAVADVLRAADDACYAAKRTGRDAVRVWSEEGGVVDTARPG